MLPLSPLIASTPIGYLLNSHTLVIIWSEENRHIRKKNVKVKHEVLFCSEMRKICFYNFCFGHLGTTVDE